MRAAFPWHVLHPKNPAGPSLRLSDICKYISGRRVPQFRSPAATSTNEFCYLTLTCARDMALTRLSLASALRYASCNPRLVIAHDESLTSDVVASEFSDWPAEIEVYSRDNTEVFFRERGQNAIAEFCRRHIFGYKLAACLRSSMQLRTLYADADVLWFGDCNGLMRQYQDLPMYGSGDLGPAIDETAADLLDPQIAAFVRRWPRICAGFAIYNRQLVEHCVIQETVPKIASLPEIGRLAEQTVVAAIVRMCGDVMKTTDVEMIAPNFADWRVARGDFPRFARHYPDVIRPQFWLDLVLTGRRRRPVFSAVETREEFPMPLLASSSPRGTVSDQPSENNSASATPRSKLMSEYVTPLRSSPSAATSSATQTRRPSIAVVGGSWSSNIGNAFYNIGADWLVRQIQDDVWFVPESPRWKWTGMKEENFRLIGHLDCATIILVGPCLNLKLRDVYGPSFRRFYADGGKVGYLSVGMSLYDRGEAESVRQFFREFPPAFVATRDRLAFELLAPHLSCPVISSVCTSMFLNDAYDPPPIRLDPYVVLNFDEKEPRLVFDADGVATHAPSLSVWQKLNYSAPDKIGGLDIVRTSNLSIDDGYQRIFSRPKTYHSDLPWGYCSILKNAEFVYSERVHTCAATMIYGGRAQFITQSTRSNEKRSLLFEAIGAGDIFDRPVSIDFDSLNPLKAKLKEFLSEVLN